MFDLFIRVSLQDLRSLNKYLTTGIKLMKNPPVRIRFPITAAVRRHNRRFSANSAVRWINFGKPCGPREIRKSIGSGFYRPINSINNHRGVGNSFLRRTLFAPRPVVLFPSGGDIKRYSVRGDAHSVVLARTSSVDQMSSWQTNRFHRSAQFFNRRLQRALALASASNASV